MFIIDIRFNYSLVKQYNFIHVLYGGFSSIIIFRIVDLNPTTLTTFLGNFGKLWETFFAVSQEMFPTIPKSSRWGFLHFFSFALLISLILSGLRSVLVSE